MNLKEAMEVVLELARQNTIEDIDMEEEAKKQIEATNVVEAFFEEYGHYFSAYTNQYEKDTNSEII